VKIYIKHKRTPHNVQDLRCICAIYRPLDQCLLSVHNLIYDVSMALFSLHSLDLSGMSRSLGLLQEVVSLVLHKPETTKLACDRG